MVKILIVDDEASIIRMLKFALKKEGYNVITASNGREGYESALEDTPSLIISDIMMPEMDGLEMCNLVRQQSELKNIPFIFLTAKGDMSTRIQGLQSGADDFVVKPIDFKNLTKKIKQMLNYEVASDVGLSEPELFQEVKLSGNFADKKPVSVLQNIESERLTGILDIDENGSNLGQVSFFKGSIIAANYGTSTGKDGVFKLLDEKSCDYRFVVKPIEMENQSAINVSTTIMEWTASQADDQEKKTKYVLKRKTQYEVILVPDFFDLTANKDIQTVIRNLQVGKSVGYVLDNSGLSVERILKIFRYLLSKEILKEK